MVKLSLFVGKGREKILSVPLKKILNKILASFLKGMRV